MDAKGDSGRRFLIFTQQKVDLAGARVCVEGAQIAVSPWFAFFTMTTRETRSMAFQGGFNSRC